MEGSLTNISLCTLNCRSVKNSVVEISSLCNDYDIVFLQEHWLLPHDLDFLATIHPDYLAVGQSAVDIDKDVLVGRPYGGTGILYNRKLSKYVTHVKVKKQPMHCCYAEIE